MPICFINSLTMNFVSIRVEYVANDSNLYSFEISYCYYNKCVVCRDSDGDGIPDAKDLDSDNDACFDAVEGVPAFNPTQLNTNGGLQGGVNADGIPNSALPISNTCNIGTSIDNTAVNNTYCVITCTPPSAPSLSVTNNVCPSVTGTYNVVSGCGAGTYIQYSTNSGTSWVSSLPAWVNGQSLIARCVNDADMTCKSVNSNSVTAALVACPDPCVIECVPVKITKK